MLTQGSKKLLRIKLLSAMVSGILENAFLSWRNFNESTQQLANIFVITVMVWVAFAFTITLFSKLEILHGMEQISSKNRLVSILLWSAFALVFTLFYALSSAAKYNQLPGIIARISITANNIIFPLFWASMMIHEFYAHIRLVTGIRKTDLSEVPLWELIISSLKNTRKSLPNDNKQNVRHHVYSTIRFITAITIADAVFIGISLVAKFATFPESPYAQETLSVGLNQISFTGVQLHLALSCVFLDLFGDLFQRIYCKPAPNRIVSVDNNATTKKLLVSP